MANASAARTPRRFGSPVSGSRNASSRSPWMSNSRCTDRSASRRPWYWRRTMNATIPMTSNADRNISSARVMRRSCVVSSLANRKRSYSAQVQWRRPWTQDAGGTTSSPTDDGRPRKQLKIPSAWKSPQRCREKQRLLKQTVKRRQHAAPANELNSLIQYCSREIAVARSLIEPLDHTSNAGLKISHSLNLQFFR